MGKGKSQTVGFWYLPAFHAGLGIGPLDAFLEFRGGDKAAWVGELTASGSISINAPMLWGGEKDQGGIVGAVDVMFGETDQQPSAYLASVFGDQQPAWRGLATLVFKGGKYGAMNPYPQKASYKIRKITKGWDGDDCWYKERAAIVIEPGAVFTSDLAFAATNATIDGAYAGIELDSGFTADDILVIDKPAGLTYQGWSYWSSDANPLAGGRPWTNAFWVTDGSGTTTQHWGGDTIVDESVPVDERYSSAAAAESAMVTRNVYLSGSTYYRVWLFDTPPGDNRGGLSVRIRKNGLLAMNPAHILYYSITQADMGREPITSINAASFQAAADWYFAQGFGLCTAYDPSAESVEEFQQRICRVAGCSLTRSLIDGQWYLDIANGEYELDSLPILTDDDILEFEEQPTLLDSAVNSVSVKYFDPDKKEEIVTPPVQAPALIAEFGTNHLTIDYLEIPSAALATRVAQRELLARITPLRGFPLKTTRKPYAWRPSTYFRLQTPKRGIADMVCIFSEKSSGQLRSGAMAISATQDVYSMPAASFVEVETGVDTSPNQTPVAITQQRAFEAPYIDVIAALSTADFNALDEEAGFLLAVAHDPATSRDYTMFTGPVGGPYVQGVDGNWCPTALIVEAADRTTGAFTLSASKRLVEVEVGSAGLWDDEIVRVDAINAITGDIELGRGCADTVPTEHAAGSRIWFYGVGAAADLTEFTASETIGVKLLTNTGSQQLPLASATEMEVDFDQRILRPYPPAHVKIGGVSWPSVASGTFTVTWGHRNRVAQADQLVDTMMASVTAAPNTRYGLRFEKVSDDSLLVARTDIGPGTADVVLDYAGDVRMRLWTISEDGASWQEHVHQFSYSSPGASNTITATAYTPVYDGTIIDGGDLDG